MYLIGKEDSKAERTVFVKDWVKVEKGDLTQVTEAEGVLKPLEEYPVFYEGSEGAEFKGFLVEEGDEVTAGTPLLEYSLPAPDGKIKELEAEKAQAEAESAAIETYIGKLTSYKETVISETAAEPERDQDLEEELAIEPNASLETIEAALEQEIYRQEYEMERTEARIAKCEAELAYLNEAEDSIQVMSEMDGIIKEIKKTLANPVVTVVSKQTAVYGELTEKQIDRVRTGQKVQVTLPGEEKTLTGKVEKTGPYPVQDPGVKKESLYPFKAILDGEQQNLTIGKHLTAGIVTAEAKGVPVVKKDVIAGSKKEYVYKLAENGRIQKRYVTAGLTVNGRTEIVKGSTQGDLLLESPPAPPHNHSPFITAVQFEKADGKRIKQKTAKELLRPFLIGFFEK